LHFFYGFGGFRKRRRKKNNEFISLLCVCGTLESRNLISHVFLIICVAVQANPIKEEDEAAAA
jgi:hypothetical protein